MAKRSSGKRKKWEPSLVKLKQTKVGQERFEQLLAEVGEVLYKRLRQQVQDKARSVSLEPALNELGPNQKNKAVS
jgi:hypothetical protein